jgi:hypothetical protein
MHLALPKGDFYRKAEDIHHHWFEVLCKNECNTMIIAPRRHKHPSSGDNGSSDVAVTVNNNAEFNLSII